MTGLRPVLLSGRSSMPRSRSNSSQRRVAARFRRSSIQRVGSLATAKRAGSGFCRARRTKVSPFATAAIRLLLLTGCRLREILNLRREASSQDRHQDAGHGQPRGRSAFQLVSQPNNPFAAGWRMAASGLDCAASSWQSAAASRATRRTLRTKRALTSRVTGRSPISDWRSWRPCRHSLPTPWTCRAALPRRKSRRAVLQRTPNIVPAH